MSGQFAGTPYIWSFLVSVLFMLGLCLYGWYNRAVPGALPFSLLMLLWSLLSLCSILEITSSDISASIFWTKSAFLLSGPTALAGLWFVLAYARLNQFLTRPYMIPAVLFVFLGTLFILTNNLHHWVWEAPAHANGDLHLMQAGGYWVLLTVGYLLIFLTLPILLWLFIRSPLHRWPVAFLLAGQIAVRSALIMSVAGFNPVSPFSPLAIASMFLAVTYAVALFGFGIFDPITLARRTAVEQAHSGMVVLDREGRVVSLNPAAERILELRTRQVAGKPARDLLPACPVEALHSNDETEIDLSLGEGQDLRNYTMAVSLLKDFRGLEAGRLLMLRDVTAQKRIQAQILEQQRTLAMMQEREQLAQELHDNLGQVFASLNVQGQSIRRLLDQGDISTADCQVSRLIEVAREADVDIRESILGLRVALSEQGFIPSLTQYLAKYEKNNGIRTRLEGSEMITDGLFEPLVEVQLLRILQEALTNIRKHAGLCSVWIAFTREDGYAHISVRDNGQGFELATRKNDQGEHIGLRVMRERAREVGGSLSLQSQPGQGTEMIVHMPVRESVRA
jgi:PAS domain S-box-containing protein